MQLVFVNTFEKGMDEEGRIARARVSICERQGMWQVIWEHEGEQKQTVWYEGVSWGEMLTVFRHGLAVQMGEGYLPVIDGMLDERPHGRSMGGPLSLLHCYGELHADAQLYERLREWRRSKAIEQKKAAYVIATNRMLQMISAFVPQRAEELLQLPGWGEAKHAAYGADILKLTVTWVQPSPFPLDWVSSTLDSATYTQWLYKQKERKYKEEMTRHQERRHILGAVAGELTVEELHTMLELPRREVIARMEQLEAEGYDLDPLIERSLAEVTGEEQAIIWTALQELGDDYLKPLLGKVYSEEQLRGKELDIYYDRLRLMRIRYRRSSSSNVNEAAG